MSVNLGPLAAKRCRCSLTCKLGEMKPVSLETSVNMPDGIAACRQLRVTGDVGHSRLIPIFRK